MAMALAQYTPKAREEIVANLIAYLVSQSSGFSNFRPGSRILTLLEALAIELAKDEGDFFEFYSKAIREACYLAFGFDLKPGNRAVGQVRVYHSGHVADYVIPAFTISLFGVNFSSEASPPVIPIGDTFIDVNMSADDPGDDGNIVAGSIDTDLGQGDVAPDTFNDYLRITNLTDFALGTDIETEAEREARFQDFINNLARSTLSGIRAFVRNVPGVVDAIVEENVNPYTGDPETGWVNIFISDGTGSTDPALITLVKKIVDGDPDDVANYPGLRAAGTESYVGTILVQAVNLDLTLYLIDTSSYTDEEITAIVENAISSYVNRLSSGQDVLLQQITAHGLMAGAPDLIKIVVNSPGADITVAPGYVPKIGGTGGGAYTITAINRIPFP